MSTRAPKARPRIDCTCKPMIGDHEHSRAPTSTYQHSRAQVRSSQCQSRSLRALRFLLQIQLNLPVIIRVEPVCVYTKGYMNHTTMPFSFCHCYRLYPRRRSIYMSARSMRLMGLILGFKMLLRMIEGITVTIHTKGAPDAPIPTGTSPPA